MVILGVDRQPGVLREQGVGVAPLAAVLALGKSLMKLTPAKQSQEETILTPELQAEQVLSLQPSGDRKDCYPLETQQGTLLLSLRGPQKVLLHQDRMAATCTERKV